MTAKISPEEDEFLRDVSQRVHWYSTPLLRLRDKPGKSPEVDLIGSGTFVSIEGTYGILTAHHVAASLSSDCALGLILMEKLHRFVVDQNHFTICHLAVPVMPSTGPDLSFIRLHNRDIGTIRAYKQFYNLSGARRAVLSNILPINHGVWFIWGIPGEQTTIEPPENNFRHIMGLYGYCSAARATNERQSGEHDYIEIAAEYGKGLNVPASFGGYSGGGIWQVTYQEVENRRLNVIDVVFSGVTFYQSEIKDQLRFITCHGRRSVYEYAYSKIMEKCA